MCLLLLLLENLSAQKSTNYSCRCISIDSPPDKTILSPDTAEDTLLGFLGSLSECETVKEQVLSRCLSVFFFLIQSFYFSIWFCF